MKKLALPFLAGFIVCLALFAVWSFKPGQNQSENGPVYGPNEILNDRDYYYPQTEVLAEDEMRIIALGTGMPNQRPSQKAACFLVELGNGEKFLFDLGTGSSDNLVTLGIPYDYLDKVFLGHLHTDHFGDFGALYVGGLLGGRTVPLRIWGPSGDTPERGTKYAIEHWRKALSWDVDGRAGRLPASGQQLEVTEFDFRQENQIVYEENGVVIRSFPAIHVLDGPVSYSLEYKGLKFVFSSDTYPNTWMKEYAQNADVVIHECFITVDNLVEKMNFPVERALNVGTQIHTSPEAFGKVMSDLQPRMAIAYHFFNDFETINPVYEAVRTTYDGPLSMAKDMMVWNVTKEDIKVREVIFAEDVWVPPLVNQVPVDRSIMETNSEWTLEHVDDISEVINDVYSKTNSKYGTDIRPDIE
jgi:ribonuclease Z